MDQKALWCKMTTGNTKCTSTTPRFDQLSNFSQDPIVSVKKQTTTSFRVSHSIDTSWQATSFTSTPTGTIPTSRNNERQNSPPSVVTNTSRTTIISKKRHSCYAGSPSLLVTGIRDHTTPRMIKASTLRRTLKYPIMGNQLPRKFNDDYKGDRRDIMTTSASRPRKNEKHVYLEIGAADEATEHDSRAILQLFALQDLDHDSHGIGRQGRGGAVVLKSATAADNSNNIKCTDAQHGQETIFEQRDALFPISTPLLTKGLTSSSTFDGDDDEVEIDDMETDSWWNSSQQTTIPKGGDEVGEVVDPNNIMERVGEVVGFVSNESSPEQKENANTINDIDCSFQRIQESSFEESIPLVGFQNPLPKGTTFLDEPKRFKFATVTATQREGRQVTSSEHSDFHCRSPMLNTTPSKGVLDDEQSSDVGYSHQLNAIEIELAGLTAQHRKSNRKLLWDEIEDAASAALRCLIAETKAQSHENSKNLVLLLVRPHVITEFRLQQRAARIHNKAQSERVSRRCRHDLLSQHPTSFAMTARKSDIPLRNTESLMMKHQKRPAGEEEMVRDYFPAFTNCRSASDHFRSSLHGTNSTNLKIVLKGVRWGVPLPTLVSGEFWEENAMYSTS